MWDDTAGWLLWTLCVPEVKAAVRQTTNKLFTLVMPTQRPQAHTLSSTDCTIQYDTTANT